MNLVNKFKWLLAITIGLFMTGCSDKVDDSNLYVFKGDMVSTFLTRNSESFSKYIELAGRVHLSNKSQSTVMDLLSTRGNYTCFAPNNDALQAYVDSIMDTPNYPIEQLDDSIASFIIKNSIIDTGDDKAYETDDFVEGALTYQNLNDRYVTVTFDTINGRASFIINSDSRIVDSDNECENGYVQVVDKVVSLSADELPALIAMAPNLKIFTRLLQETGWEDELIKYTDYEYEDNHPETGNALGPSVGGGVSSYLCPEHRRFGYTAFVETDSVFEKEWGIKINVSEYGAIENWDEVKRIIEEKCAAVDIYSQTSNAAGSPQDWTDPDNVVNQFVAYHLTATHVPYDLLVIHMNEMGYSYMNTSKLSLNVTRNFESMGKQRRLFCITEGESTSGKRLNRYSSYDDDTYEEVTVFKKGALINPSNGNHSNNALNGFYYPIDEIMVYDSYVRDNVLGGRLRFDLTDYMPEAGGNDFGNPHKAFSKNLPNGYLSKVVRITDDTWQVCLNEASPQNWVDVNCNEILFLGQYDFTLELPPVPVTGTYEFRWGLSNADWRGMCQAYFGEDPDNLPAIGVPLDLRLLYSSPAIGWVEDDPDDPQVGIENDKALRNRNYMKGPKLYGVLDANGVSRSFRLGNGSNMLSLRYIFYRGTLKADTKYYVRFKNVLTNPYAQFFGDYFEFVPKSVYDGVNPENVW